MKAEVYKKQIECLNRWLPMHKKHLKREAWFTTLNGIFVGLTLVLAFLSPGPVVTLIAILWFVILLLTIASLPVLVTHCIKEWRVFRSIVSLDPGLESHKWASGRLGKVLAFLRYRRVPHDPIRDGFVQIAGFVRKSRRKTDEGR